MDLVAGRIHLPGFSMKLHHVTHSSSANARPVEQIQAKALQRYTENKIDGSVLCHALSRRSTTAWPHLSLQRECRCCAWQNLVSTKASGPMESS